MRTQALLLFLAASASLFGQSRTNRYALVLADPPLASDASFGKAGARTASVEARTRIAAAQNSLRAVLAGRKVKVLGSADTVANAMFVYSASPEALASLPGVVRVVPMREHRRQMVKALELVRAQLGWNNVGGPEKAGAGVKIAIIDSGIDKDHPAFQDSSLAMPSGYPRCSGSDCSYASNKIIAVRSYVSLLVLGGDPQYSRPDDLTPRDRVGHGTAVAFVAAGNHVDSAFGRSSGVAPKAWIGNYKVLGSPGVNDVTFSDVFIQALDDAVKDGMNIAVYSYGAPALWAPDDRGDTCGNPGTGPCDLDADAVENATRAGLTVVVSTGNDGDIGTAPPTLNTITTPATAPSAISVGATTNSQRYVSSLRTPASAPPSIREAAIFFSDGPKPTSAVTAPMKDVRTLENDGTACTPLANGSLSGMFALIDRGGECGLAAKSVYAQQAGAIGVVLVQSGGSDSIFPLSGLAGTGIPLAMIGATPGGALRGYVNANPGARITLDPALRAEAQTADQIAFFSSYGPNIGDTGIKPEVVAPGAPLYMATQRLDPNGDLYDASGWVAAEGTSFAAPIAAGVAAIFKQRFPNATPAQIKSGVVNSASADIDDTINGVLISPARIIAMGAGKVNVNDTSRATLIVEPSVLSFGNVGRTAPTPQTLVFRNVGDSTYTVRIDNRPRNFSDTARVTLSTLAFPLAPGATQQVVATLQGTVPVGGYEGEFVVSGGATSIRIPYLYIRSNNVLFDAFALSSYNFDGVANQRIPGGLVLKATDQYGLPLQDLPVQYRVTRGGGTIVTGSSTTDSLGIAAINEGYLGPEVGEQEFAADVGTGSSKITVVFPGRVRLYPTIRSGGVVDAAGGTAGRGMAPGSYISIFGQNLSDVTRAGVTASLPLSLANVSVSFDVPNRGLSVPGRLHFVSPDQINVQIPWEFRGLNSVFLKVSIGQHSSAIYTVPLNNVSPNAFEFTDPGTGRRLAAALDSNFALVYDANKAKKGQFIQVYCNGLGDVDTTPPSGEPSPAAPLARTTAAPVVSIGGRPAEVAFSGLAPGIVGLYQINVRVPADAPSGLQPLVIQMGDVTGKTANIPVE